MTAIRGYIPAIEERSALGVHSLDRFVLAVPDLLPAQRFYMDFGLDVRAAGNMLTLSTAADDHPWGLLVEGKRKRLHHLSFGCYPDDLPYLQERVEANGAELVEAPVGFESNGFWLRDPAGLLVEVKVAPKTSPAHKMCGTWSSSAEGVVGAPLRQNAPVVRPRRLSHVLVFTTDIDKAIECSRHAPLQLGHGQRRRHRAGGHEHGRQGTREGMGPGPPRARLELFPLRAGSLGQLRGIFLRYRLYPGRPAMGRQVPSARGLVLSVGPRAAGRFYDQR